MNTDSVKIVIPINCSVSQLINQVNYEMNKRGNYLSFTTIPKQLETLPLSEFLSITNRLSIEETIESPSESPIDNSSIKTQSPTIPEKKSIKLKTKTRKSGEFYLPQQLATCHYCKKRKPVSFQCLKFPSHRFCQSCLKKTKCSGICPICTDCCGCSRCRSARQSN
ncbi:hypothetical protein EHI8A_062470 [Entamoeba histolytica HM-1:IMSS-B]|uniref:Uncharacterized protein n=6 Tax=Entamoeba histolytica TaxID=5759 RepID=C4M6W1_ENTH1|nr:hypothetical protein EHI_139320 [Entamoeba histolytica HM-1:IMSS]EMD46345.1 Hypothetical protein EHI5A_101950 [Entamoeba histolytica KU27]EMH73021.1 hypothetical protein EHI8A_062470 [Entamoeba histolytica HM-1:IMSS-B]EMS11678.1 hypothetical protein KM1_119270 [Entamoeba histolytica HM-3:IMSS]ENY63901.1 hypothetical protein EHI7A_065030 [Entamoeba histolytica HM-1:IMSS-A]GAT97241.1 hypothetical protein CL6EHI_139320 [Entamoeba histolytica]|eukprot:XP_651319.1 hypothetical protein EHI_139320 [Entamoeba histolytica HM-1:IMSS]